MPSTLGYLGPYRLLNVVHNTNTSQIWQAYDDGKQRKIGIKTLVDKYRKDGRQIGYLRWEFAVGRKVLHPRLIEIYQFDTDKGRPYLAMEWFAGPNMKSLIHQGAGKIAHLVPKIVEQAAEGLAHFNGAGFVHRDIKPHNFLVGEDGDVKLIDFALAQRSREGLARLFARKTRLEGTRSYMAPEQIRGAVLDRRADVYSFGCTVFELIAGTPPFTGANANELLNRHLKAPVPSLEAANRNVTPEFALLVRRTMAKNPHDRPASLSDFLAGLRAKRIYKETPKAPGVSQG